MTLTLERPCGCSEASTGPSVLGQKVKIMEGVGNSGAGGQRVHIADVGKTASGRSTQVVHIRPELVTCDCGITDTFERTEASGLGTSDAGVAWDNTYGTTELSEVDGTQAVLRSLAFNSSTHSLATGMPESWTCEVVFTWPSVDPGGTQRLLFDVTDNPASEVQYLRFSVDRNGDVLRVEWWDGSTGGNDTLGVTITTGGTGTLKAAYDAVTGVLEAKYWEGASEPAYQVSVTASGLDPLAALLMQFSCPGDLATTYEMSVESIDVTDFNVCMFDNFNRAEASDWGTATPSGAIYSYPGTPTGTVNLSVADGVGVYDMAANSGWSVRLPVNAMWTEATGFVMTYDFLMENVVGSGSDAKRIQVHLYHEPASASDFEVFMVASSDPGYGILAVYTTPGSDELEKTDWLDDTWYRIKIEYRPGSIFRARIWERADTEPETWDVSTSSVDTALDSYLQLDISNFSAAGAVKCDNITFNTCPLEE